MQIALLLTGNELMTGDTVDSNSAMIAQNLAVDGFDVAHKVTVGDDLKLLVAQMTYLAEHYPVVIVNGGLGPTIDDLTAQALANMASVQLEEHDQARQHVLHWCEHRGMEANAANLKQALLPQGAAILANPVGSAVGIEFNFKQCWFMCTPGVPSELKAMLGGSLTESLKRRFSSATSRRVRRLKLFGIGESTLQQLLIDECPDWPEQVDVGFRAGAPLLELKLESDNETEIHWQHQCEQKLRELIGDYIVGENDDSLPEIVVRSLQERGQKITLAESCTGGLIASQITSVAGASEVFEAGFVTYSNEMKSQLLNVDPFVIDAEGAVSAAVVESMAKGALSASAADYVIAVSGIAGPGGGSAEKPVGTVWLAWGDSQNINSHRFFYPVGRQMFQTMISAVALDLMRRHLLGQSGIPGYFQRDRKKL